MSGQLENMATTSADGAALEAELRARLEQQAVIAELGMRALAGTDLATFSVEAVHRITATLGVGYGAILELQPEGDLLLRAGVGWQENLMGHVRLPTNNESQAGYTLLNNGPVIVDDMVEDERFGKRPLMHEHGIASGLSVIIPRASGPWGVLTVHSSERKSFSVHDVSFVQSVANILGELAERAEFEEVQAHLAAIVEYSHDAIFRKSTEGIITTWNAAAQRMYGYTPEEVVGRRVDLLFPPELKHTFEEIMSTVRAGGSVGPMDTVRVCKDGRRIPISLTVSPISDRHGNVIAASTIAHDITDRKRVETSLKRAHDDLEERIAERTRELRDVIRELESFTYAVSHDLRAPLRSVDGFARALDEDYGDELSEGARNYLSRILNGSRRMSSLIDELLNLSRLTHGPLHVGRVDLSNLARRIRSDLTEREPERNVEWQIPVEMPVRGDQQLLTIVLTNLIDNAWKFTRGRDSALIELGKTEEGGRTVFFVRDNGMGFDKRYADRLFVPFQRLHSSEVEGTGIGLATVQRIVHRHGGQLWADSTLDEGSTFFFTLDEGDPAGEARMSQEGPDTTTPESGPAAT